MGGPAGVRPEVLFLINLAFDLLFLWFAASISWVRPRWWRLLLAAGLGAAAAVLPALVPGAAWLTSGPAVLFLSLVLVLLAVWPCSWAQFAAVFGGFWLSLALAGGVVKGLHERYASPVTSVSVVLVGGGVLLATIGILLVWQSYRERKPVRDAFCNLRVYLAGQNVVLTGLVDSGNGLRTPLGRRPVAVVEVEPLRPLLPPGVLEGLSMGWEALTAVPEGWRQRCQLIPYAVVGRPDGALLVIAPDRLAIQPRGGGSWVEVSGALGLTDQLLDPQGHYQALLPPQMLAEAEAGRAGVASIE